MKPRIRPHLLNFPYGDAYFQRHQGLMTEREWKSYVNLWVWCAARHSSVEAAGVRQDRYYRWAGDAGLQRRHQRALKIRASLLKGFHL